MSWKPESKTDAPSRSPGWGSHPPLVFSDLHPGRGRLAALWDTPRWAGPRRGLELKSNLELLVCLRKEIVR